MVDVRDCVDERPGCFLGQVVSDAAGNGPVGVLAREIAGIRAGLWVRCPVGVTLEGDGRHRNHWSRSELFLQIVVRGFAGRQPEPPPVVADDDVDVVGIVERTGGAAEGLVI